MRRTWLLATTFMGLAALASTGCGSDDNPNPIPDYDSGSDTTDGGGDVTPPPDTPDSTPTDGDTSPPPVTRTTPTNGSAIAVTKDDKFVVAANRTAGSVSVFKLDPTGATPLTKVATLDTGKTSEPWAVVIGNDDDTAYVIARKDQAVLRIKGIKGTPSLDAAKGKTGSEPTGLAIAPNGGSLYVANWSEGTVSVINTSDLATSKTIDLNAALASSGMLGSGVAGRPGLAHPRALVVTNNGDASDADETVYVTEFFSQARTDTLPTDDSQFDVARQGVIYQFNAGTGTVGAPITIAPIADTSFVDSKGVKAGCFPNQLFAAALNNKKLYVTSVCESPRGPTGPDAAPVAPGVGTSNFKTEIFSAVFAIDTATNKELPNQGVLLTKAFQSLYDVAPATADDATRRMPLIANDIMFAAGTKVAYLTSYGSDAVFRVAYNDDGSLKEVGAPSSQKFINLKPGGAVSDGVLPVGIAGTNAGVATSPFAVVVNENSRNVSLITFATQTVSTSAASADAPATTEEQAVNRGQKFFATGLGRWSLKGQAWNSCAGCHPDGLTDNVTWYFARGPRQTTSLDGTYDPKDPLRRRILNWTGIFDEVHDFELNTRGNSGGVGAIVHQNTAPPAADDRIVFDGTALTGAQKATTTLQNGLNGSTISMMPGGATTPLSVLPDWNDVDKYVISIRAPKKPSNLVAADVTAGEALFKANNCAACHGGSHWTISHVFYSPNETNNAIAGLLRDATKSYTLPSGYPSALNPPANNTTKKALLRFSGVDAADNGANDQINCILRDVGTFATTGVAPTGVVVKEVRTNMTTAAQGATGMNPPSLLGMVTGAPYFHAGNARTLEEAFATTFSKHYTAHSTLFAPDATQIKQLVAYLLSIDEDATAVPVPTTGTITFDPDLCPKTFP